MSYKISGRQVQPPPSGKSTCPAGADFTGRRPISLRIAQFHPAKAGFHCKAPRALHQPRHLGHNGRDVDRLGAVAGAAAAGDAVGGGALRLDGGDRLFNPSGAIDLIAVVDLKELGDVDLHRTSVAAVAAGGAGHPDLGVELFADRLQQLLVGVRQGAEVGEGGEVVLRLGKGGHAAEDHLHLREGPHPP